MARAQRPFGQRGAAGPPVLHAPGGLPGGPAPPSKPRKMSLSVGLVALGAMALAGGGLYEAKRRADRDQACREAAIGSGASPAACQTASSSSGSRSHWFFSSGSSSSSSTSATHTTPGGHASFGGFGASGHAHSGGS